MKLKRTVSFLFFFISVLTIGILASCQNEKQMEFNRYYSGGSLVYQQHCQNCHGANGEGLQSLIPPLTDSLFLKSNKNKLACAIKYGLKDKITIGGKNFEGAMPPNALAPIEIAEVITYVTNTFGNKGETVNLDMVNADLTNCK